MSTLGSLGSRQSHQSVPYVCDINIRIYVENVHAYLAFMRFYLAFSTLVLSLRSNPLIAASKYCSLVVKEGGMEKLEALIMDPRPYERIKELASLVIEHCQHYEDLCDDINVSPSALEAEYNMDG